MKSRYSVGTFWKFTDDSLFYMIMGSFGEEYSTAYYDPLDGNVHFMMVYEESLDNMVPSTNLDINNIIIEAVSTQP